jgi:hypothetical protein
MKLTVRPGSQETPVIYGTRMIISVFKSVFNVGNQEIDDFIEKKES